MCVKLLLLSLALSGWFEQSLKHILIPEIILLFQSSQAAESLEKKLEITNNHVTHFWLQHG